MICSALVREFSLLTYLGTLQQNHTDYNGNYKNI